MKPLFNYCLSHDKDVATPICGINLRKFWHPLVIETMKAINPYKLEISKDSYEIKDNKPKIFVTNHGYREDLMNTLLAIGSPTYVLAGNVDLFMNSLDGFCMWLNGSVLIDRKDKESKISSFEKMEQVLKTNCNMVIFPEATWNLSDNKLTLPLFGGFYDLAMRTDLEIIPITTYPANGKCYVKIDNPINVKDYDNDKLENLEFIITKSISKINEYSYKVNEKELKKELKELESISSEFNTSNKKNEIIKECIFKANIILNKINLYETKETRELEKYYLVIIKEYIKKIINVERNYYRELIRDIFATNRYNFMEKYGEMREHNLNLEEIVQSEKIDIMSKSKYYILEDEKEAEYKDKLIIESNKVFKKTF